MTFVTSYSCNLEILRVLNATFFHISKNIVGAIELPLPTALIIIQSALVTTVHALSPIKGPIESNFNSI